MKDAEGYCCEFDNDPDDDAEDGTPGNESFHYKRLCPYCNATFWSLHCCHELSAVYCHACNRRQPKHMDGSYDTDPTYTREDLIRVVLGQQWAVACKHLVVSGLWSMDLEWPGRVLIDIGCEPHHHRPKDNEPVAWFFLDDGVGLQDLPCAVDVVDGTG